MQDTIWLSRDTVTGLSGSAPLPTSGASVLASMTLPSKPSQAAEYYAAMSNAAVGQDTATKAQALSMAGMSEAEKTKLRGATLPVGFSAAQAGGAGMGDSIIASNSMAISDVPPNSKKDRDASSTG